MLRSDRGGEHFLEIFNNFCEENGIIHPRTTRYTLQQNGITERKNRSSIDKVKAVLMNAKLLFTLWNEALLIVCHICNKIPFKKFLASPYELWNFGTLEENLT